MLDMTKTFQVTTDGNGFYHTTQTFTPPGPFSLTVNIFASFTLPPGNSVNCSVSLTSPGSAPQSKTFIAQNGQKISLGTWHVAHQNNVLVIQGSTSPPLPNANVSVDVEADIAGF
jgi:hypothetical protein